MLYDGRKAALQDSSVVVRIPLNRKRRRQGGEFWCAHSLNVRVYTPTIAIKVMVTTQYMCGENSITISGPTVYVIHNII